MSHEAEVNLPALREDATNRALRTFLQGLAIDILVAVAVLAYTVTSGAEPIAWAAVGASLIRTSVQTAASYVMRRFLDSSKVPTPLPPSPVPPPAEPAGEPYGA